jgi:EAL domain-containing protein (putative c-di-GMP-specific phosphodiesterase class I)
MTRYMTDTAARRAADGHPAHVDLDPDALTDPEFLEHVITCVRRHRAAPGLITFGFPPAELWHSRRLIDRLSACGFLLAISEG